MQSKLAEVMLYIAKKCEEDKSFGLTKLNKILFLADFVAYGVYGVPLTDTQYRHAPQGPVAEDYQSALTELRGSGRGTIRETVFFGFPQKRLVAHDEPDLSWLTPEQRELLDRALRYCDDKNGSELSELSHRMLPWLYTREGERIPFEWVFALAKVEPTIDDLDWASAELGRLIAEGAWAA